MYIYVFYCIDTSIDFLGGEIMLKIGSLVEGKYRVLSEIGRGGMSVVYMAINEKANKTWAIKEVRKDGVKDFEVVRQGLIVETELLKRLNHPNLPSIVDVIENEDTLLIVMDYIEGNPLSKALEEYGAQPQEYVIEWAKQLCDVLEYLHTRTPTIIYRDMKPANVMLKPDGNVTLIDFGTAREYKEKNLADTTCLGTVGYAAPEQFGGMGQTDARTDIYCLGATLYHLVTGCNPCEPPYEILPIRSINPQLSSGLERIIIKCTQRNPEDRYQSCAELMYALDHYEEIDDFYRNAQKKKFTIFASTLAMSVLFLISGLLCGFIANNETKKLYESYVLEGQNISKSVEEKRVNLVKAIQNTDYEDKSEAFNLLMDLYYKEDKMLSHVNTEEEKAKNLKSEFDEMTDIGQYIDELDPVSAADIYYYGGKLIFSFYSEDGKVSGGFAGIQLSQAWFEKAIQIAEEVDDEDANFTLYKKSGAEIYKNISKYHKEITANLHVNSESVDNELDMSDENCYSGFWKTWNDLLKDDDFMKEIEEDNSLKFAAQSFYKSGAEFFQQYATDFKHNVKGINQDSMLKICQEMEKRTLRLCDTDREKLEAQKVFERVYENIRRSFETDA